MNINLFIIFIIAALLIYEIGRQVCTTIVTVTYYRSLTAMHAAENAAPHEIVFTPEFDDDFGPYQ